MPQAFRRPPVRDIQPITLSAPSPVGGVNARDALAAMPPTDCVTATNCFGTPSYVQTPRNGCEEAATGLPGLVNTVMGYNGTTGRKLFAASVTSIYDITAGGPVGAAVLTGLTTDVLQYALFNAGVGTVLLVVNGVDTPQVYDGSSWADSTIAGTNDLTSSPLDPDTLITVTVFKQRTWYIEDATMNVWYSDTSAYQGTLIVLPLGAIFKKGGTLMQMATWTIDNVSGMDDYAVFITTEGEVAVYQGYDPSQLATWSLVGIFEIGRPIGRRCYIKLAADIIVITADGLTPLSKAMLTDRVQEDSQLTYKIINAINNDVQAFNANFGWQVIEYPLGNKLILNVPEGEGVSHQWVMNSVAKSWWPFKGWNANCWELQQDSLYFGEDTRVMLADTGLNDAGEAITCDCKPAFSYFGDPGKLKNFLMAQPVFQASANIRPQITLNLDFADIENPSPPFLDSGTAVWDVALWDTSFWDDPSAKLTIRNWQGVSGLGYAASGRISMQLRGVLAQWYATNYLVAAGGPL